MPSVTNSMTVEFIPSVACSALSGPFSTVLNAVINELNDQCHLQFMVPENIDISTKSCNPRVKRSCKDSRFYSAQMDELCKSFNATFNVFSGYQNVYCYLCALEEPNYGQKWLENDTLCQATDSERFLASTSLLVLLDDDSVNNYEPAQSDDLNKKYVCIDTVPNSTARVSGKLFRRIKGP